MISESQNQFDQSLFAGDRFASIWIQGIDQDGFDRLGILRIFCITLSLSVRPISKPIQLIATAATLTSPSIHFLNRFPPVVYPKKHLLLPIILFEFFHILSELLFFLVTPIIIHIVILIKFHAIDLPLSNKKYYCYEKEGD